MATKLSEIITEIAMLGFKDKKYGHSDLMHPLVFLAHVAWNKDTMSPDYLEDEYRKHLRKFVFPKKKITRELITDDWERILGRMMEYKREHFPKDRRIITLCAYTPSETFRVEWI